MMCRIEVGVELAVGSSEPPLDRAFNELGDAVVRGNVGAVSHAPLVLHERVQLECLLSPNPCVTADTL